jgi:hypothetical protein
MPERMRQIRQRAHALFRAENSSPALVLDSACAEFGVTGRSAVSEDVRRSYYERAEQELIHEGKIKSSESARK